VEGTRNLAKASAMKGVRRFIFISSTEVYGPRTTLDPINEVSPTKYVASQIADLFAVTFFLLVFFDRPVFDYGKSKVIAENSLKDVAFDSEDMDYVILRPCGIFNDTTTEYQILWFVLVP
jgi:nucleoside-diphosphate-sugar epimerase